MKLLLRLNILVEADSAFGLAGNGEREVADHVRAAIDNWPGNGTVRVVDVEAKVLNKKTERGKKDVGG